MLSDAGTGKYQEGQIHAQLKDAGLNNIGVLKVLKPVTETFEKKKTTSNAADAFAAALTHAAQMHTRGGRPNAARTKRIVHKLVDLAQEDGYVLVALAGMRGVAPIPF